MKPFSQIVISVALLSCSLASAMAQDEIYFRHLTRSEGLLHDNVTCAVQDSLGYMWFGTHRGLNRFDGYTVDSYKDTTPGTGSIYVNRVFGMQIAGHYLWQATEAGLVCFDLDEKRYVSLDYADKTTANFVKSVRKVRPSGLTDQLWAISDNQIRLLHVAGAKNGKGLTVGSVRLGSHYGYVSAELNPCVASDGHGTAWLSGNTYLSTYKRSSNGQYAFTGRMDNQIGAGVRDMCYADGCLWLAYANRLAKYRVERDGHFTLQGECPIDTHTGILSITHDAAHVWVATQEGLYKVAKKTMGTPIVYRHSATNPHTVGNDINNVYVDRSGNVWVTGWTAGVSYASPRPMFFRTVHETPFTSIYNSVDAEFVSVLHNGHDGYIYMGSKFGGISRYNVSTGQTDWNYCVSPELLRSITAIASDGSRLFASASNNIVLIDKSTGKLNGMLTTANEGYIFHMAFDRFHRLWVATYAGLECFVEENGQWKNKMVLTAHSPAPCRLSTDLLHNICSDMEANELVVTSTMGLNRVIFDNEGKVVRIVNYLARNDGKGLSSNFVWAIDKGGKATYWVGTMGSGLNKVTFVDGLNGKYSYTAEQFGMAEGAESNDIESIEVDRFGRVWCGGLNLCYFDPDANRFNCYRVDDGLQSYAFGTSSAAKDDEGNLYFGGAKGMNVFKPVSEEEEAPRLHVFFTHVAVNGQVLDGDVEHTNRVTLRYPDNNMTVCFTTLSYEHSHHVRFRYRIEGYDKNWHYVAAGEQPQAFYQKVPYGHHRLVVEAGDWQSWSGETRVLDVYSRPPFWLSWWAYLSYLLLAAVLVYMGVRWFLKWTKMKNIIQMRREREQQQQEMVDMKMRFFADVAHEFRTPLTLIRHAVGEVEETEGMEHNKYVHAIAHNTGTLMRLINELLDFHRADMKSMELRTTQTQVVPYIRSIVDEFGSWAEAARMELTMQTDVADHLTMWVDQEHFGKILGNILANSLRYAGEGSSVKVAVSTGTADTVVPAYGSTCRLTEAMEPGNQLIVKVTDTGVGISAESLPTIFERFRQMPQTNRRHVGSGIGLALVRSLIDLHHGGLLVSSRQGEGTEMVVFLPLSDTYLRADQKAVDADFAVKEYLSAYAVEYEEQGLEEETDLLTKDGKPTILLADDNHEILMLLREYFMKDFNVIMAIDGREALEKCGTALPDMIISDVMMPNMTGFELCAALKNTLHTCHIPIILLTGMAREENQIEGIEMGADAYIPKPFNPRLLRATVRSLLAKSRLIRSSTQLNENMREKITDDRQKQLFDRFNVLIKDNLSNSEFSVDHICLELGLNRTKLYSFIKQTTGMSLGKYIRKLRLDRAAELLRTTDKTVSEIGFDVGIESPSYFTRSFKEQFGVSPTEFIKS